MLVFFSFINMDIDGRASCFRFFIGLIKIWKIKVFVSLVLIIVFYRIVKLYFFFDFLDIEFFLFERI